MLACPARKMFKPSFHIDDDITVVVALVDYLTDEAADRGVGAAQSASAAMIHFPHHEKPYPIRPRRGVI